MFSFSSNNSIDLGYAMLRLVESEKRKYSEKNVITSKLIKKVIKGMEEELLVAKYKKLNGLVNKYFLHTFLIKLACRFPDYSEVDIIQYIRRLNKDEFYANYLQYVIETEEDSNEKLKVALENLSINNTMVEIPSLKTIQFLKRHSKVIQDDLIDYLEYFLPIYTKAKNELKMEIEEALLFFNKQFENLTDLLNEFNVVEKNVFEDVKEIKCYVMAFAETSLFMEIDKELCYIMIGSGLKNTFSEKFSETKKNQYFRYLGDPVKVKILELLKKDKLCAIDLVRELELNKSTISHHISQLLSVNLLIIDGKVGRKIYYSININYMRKMFDQRLMDFQ